MSTDKTDGALASSLVNLHDEVLQECLSLLPAKSLCQLMVSCTTLKRECSKNELWKALCRKKGIIDNSFVEDQNYCKGPAWKYIYSSLSKIITTGWRCQRWSELLSRIWMLKESAAVREAIADGYSCVCREVVLQSVQDHFGNSLASERTGFSMLGDNWTLHMEGGDGYYGRELSFWLSREPVESNGQKAVSDVGDSSWYHVMQLRHCVAVGGQVVESDAGQDMTSYELGHVPFSVFAQLPVGRPDEFKDDFSAALIEEHQRAGGEGPEALRCGDGLGWELDAAMSEMLSACLPQGGEAEGSSFLLLLFVRSLFSHNHSNPPPDPILHNDMPTSAQAPPALQEVAVA